MPQTIHNHFLKMPNCTKVVVTDSAAVPNGKLNNVSGPLDFCKGHLLGKGINNQAALNRQPCGYDHPFYVKGWMPGNLKQLHNATVSSSATGLTMSVYSTFPSIWVYSANNMPANASGERGERFVRYGAVCLEPQNLPDSINQPSFPQSIVRKGKPYHEEITNVFTVSTSKM
uniref:Galactose mutarotase n=1 Tax=Lygus hesperus TaxID=30085 RepID=A0A0A9XTL7_LYGHE